MKKMIIAIGSLAMLMTVFAINDAAAGPEAKCKACHTFDQGGKNKMGPNLFGIVGAKAGSKEGYKYSNSLKDGNWVWDDAKLQAWVCDSKSAIKELTGDDNAKTKMAKQNKCGDEAAAIVTYLNTLK